jgi:hypothetical protein
MWLLDETGDYPLAVMPIVEAIFSGMPIEAHIVQAGNTINRAGVLYHVHTHRDSWKVGAKVGTGPIQLTGRSAESFGPSESPGLVI